MTKKWCPYLHIRFFAITQPFLGQNILWEFRRLNYRSIGGAPNDLVMPLLIWGLQTRPKICPTG